MTLNNVCHERWGTILTILRITVALQCVGNWRWLVQIEETPLLAWFINPHDVGGLAWSESSALWVQNIIGWLALIAGLSVLVRPSSWMLGPLVLLQLAIATSMWQIDDGFVLDAVWLSLQISRLFPYVTQAARMAAPLGLLLLHLGQVASRSGGGYYDLAMTGMRWAAAVTFFAHGIEAWQHHFVFVDLLIGSAEQLLGFRLSQSSAEALLSVIGMLDMVVAAVCVATCWPSVWWWMTFWGAVTAFSRVFINDWDQSAHQILTRLPHIGLPLAVALWMHWVKSPEECDEPAPTNGSN